MKIAAVDLGSNSVHLLVAEADRRGSFHVIDREKEMVRLGAGAFGGAVLSPDGVRRALDALRRFRRLADRHGVETLVAVATAAVREAADGEIFIERVGREIGAWPRILSGEQEARLIHLAARRSIHLAGGSALVLDIGGGSVELAWGSGDDVRWAASEKLGVLRLTERFVRSDPLSRRDEERLDAYVRETVAPHARRLRRRFDIAVGTSGTVLAVGALAASRERSEVPRSLHHLEVSAEAIHDVRRRLVDSDLAGRLKLPGLDEARADIIVAGAVVLDTLLDVFGVERLTLCDWALREGVLLEYVESHREAVAQADATPDVRRRSVLDLAERCRQGGPHPAHVARLALELFDATRSRHRLGDRERTWLEHAALLHDVGHHLGFARHHKHTYYLIRHGGLRGYTPEEVNVIACVARYHRKGHPRKSHRGFRDLGATLRRAVRVLAGLLRVADALDRSHAQVVTRLSVQIRGSTLKLTCHGRADNELEQLSAARRSALLAQTLGLTVAVRAALPRGSGLSSVDEARPRRRGRSRHRRAADPLLERRRLDGGIRGGRTPRAGAVAGGSVRPADP